MVRPIYDLIANTRRQNKLPTVGKLGVKFALETQDDVTLVSPLCSVRSISDQSVVPKGVSDSRTAPLLVKCHLRQCADARFDSTANGLSPSHVCILLAISRLPVSATLARSFATVVSPIQIAVIVRRSVDT